MHPFFTHRRSMILVAFIAIGIALGNEITAHWEVDRFREEELRCWRAVVDREKDRAFCLEQSATGVPYDQFARSKHIAPQSNYPLPLYTWKQEAGYQAEWAASLYKAAKLASDRRQAARRRLLFPPSDT